MASSHVTDLSVSLNRADEQDNQARGFSKINVDLNKGAGGNAIYLWYKKQSGAPAITRVQVSFTDDMMTGLAGAGYNQIQKDLNAGAGGNTIYLWYFKGTTEYDTAIEDVDVTDNGGAEAQKIKLNWERVACNLNRKAGGKSIHVWVKRQNQTFITDITATDNFGSGADLFKAGYIRVDENTNRGAGGNFVLLWYRQTTNRKHAITDIEVSTNSIEHQEYQQGRFISVNVNLNEGTGGDPVYLWYKKEASGIPIKTLILLLNMDAVEEYEKAGVVVINRDLNSGNCGNWEYVCYYQ